MRYAGMLRHGLFVAAAVGALGFGAVQALAAPAPDTRGSACPTTCTKQCQYGGFYIASTGQCLCCYPD